MGVFSRGRRHRLRAAGVLIEANGVNVPVSHRSGAKRGPDRASRLTGRLLLRHSQVATYRSQPHTSPGLGPPPEPRRSATVSAHFFLAALVVIGCEAVQLEDI
jgi:hypothetical protein